MKYHVPDRWLGLLATVAALLLISRRTRSFNPLSVVSRRTLIKLGGLSLGAVITGAWRAGTGARAAGTPTASSLASCVLSPEQTEGPYYITREQIRRNIVERRPGALLRLRFTVVDASTCKPIKGAAVDIWHCDAGGVYSGFERASAGGPPGASGGPTDKDRFLRGVQLTNAQGRAEFGTIYPGWYRGRTVHIHVKVHLDGDRVGHVVHTGQLYFPEGVTARVYRTGAYKARAAARDTFNATDAIFQNGGRQSMLSITRDGHGGYIGTITLGVRRS